MGYDNELYTHVYRVVNPETGERDDIELIIHYDRNVREGWSYTHGMPTSRYGGTVNDVIYGVGVWLEDMLRYEQEEEEARLNSEACE